MKRIFKQVLICLGSCIVFFLCTYPLRDTFAVFTVTDVRPGIAVLPLLSMCFGPSASLGCAFANLYADYISNYPAKVLVQGFPLQFIYGFVSFLLWKKLTAGDDHSYRINSSSKFLKLLLVALVFGVISGFGVAYIVYSNYGANFVKTVFFVFMNNYTFTMLLCVPLMILANIIVSGIGKDNYRKLSANELIIIFTSLAEFVGIGVITYGIYAAYSKVGGDTYEVWNNIFIYSVIYVNAMILVALGLIKLIEKVKAKRNKQWTQKKQDYYI